MYPAFLVDIEFVWGFQARIVGLSRTSPSFHYPPPTTFLGALSQSIARELGIGEHDGKELISLIGRNVLALGVRPINCVPLTYEDINRIIAVRVLHGREHYPEPSDLAGSYDSPARGKTIMMSLDNEAPKIRVSIVMKKDYVDFKGRTINITEDHFWRIHRLGSKESRVSVVNVEKEEAEIFQQRKVLSHSSFPFLDGVAPIEEIRRKWIYEVYIDPRQASYSDKSNPYLNYMEGRAIVPYRIPLMTVRSEPPEILVEVKGEAAAYKVGDEFVVGWGE